jgi:iron uptake system component EfeO
LNGKRWTAVLVSAALGVGASVAVGACGEDRGGSVDIEGDSTGASTGSTSTTPVTVDTSATNPEKLDAAMARIGAYARKQTAQLVTSTQTLQKAVDAGDVPAAQKAYAAARPYYERIEPLVGLFPELDGKIDAREDDFPKKAADPKWTGFHPLERAAFKTKRFDSRSKKLAAGLVTDSKRLQKLMDTAVIKPSVVIPGTAELVDEIEESKITGEEERYSKLDLPTFVANLEGAKEFSEALEDLVKAKDPSLHEQIERAFDDAFAEVKKLKKGSSFVSYDQLSAGQQRQLKQTIEALAEPLARVQGTLGVGK